MDKMLNGELVARIHKGDKGAEAELLEKYWPRILKMTRYTLSKARTNCEDLANDISVAILENLRTGRFAEKSSLGTYIYGIAKNQIAGYLKGNKPELTDIPYDIPDVALTREDEMEKAQLDEALALALEKLEPKYKKVLYLHYFEGLSITETGEKMNMSPRRVSERKNYALKKLKKVFNTSPVFATNVYGE